MYLSVYTSLSMLMIVKSGCDYRWRIIKPPWMRCDDHLLLYYSFIMNRVASISSYTHWHMSSIPLLFVSMHASTWKPQAYRTHVVDSWYVSSGKASWSCKLRNQHFGIHIYMTSKVNASILDHYRNTYIHIYHTPISVNLVLYRGKEKYVLSHILKNG